MPQYPALIQLSSLDGTNGFKINGVAADDTSGISVASAGDVNGDGFADLIIGAWRADPEWQRIGRQLRGVRQGLGLHRSPRSLGTRRQQRLQAQRRGDRRRCSGCSVASAGDVNGDGFADLIIGAHYADPTRDRFGRELRGVRQGLGLRRPLSIFPRSTARNGFKINGEAAGDRSGDLGRLGRRRQWRRLRRPHHRRLSGCRPEREQLLRRELRGVRQGRRASATHLNLSALDGSNGFKINGEAADDRSGSVGRLGRRRQRRRLRRPHHRGADGRTPTATIPARATSCSARPRASPPLSISRRSTARNGFKINGEAADDRSGSSVASAGDVNGDGFADLIIGANPGASGAATWCSARPRALRTP